MDSHYQDQADLLVPVDQLDVVLGRVGMRRHRENEGERRKALSRDSLCGKREGSGESRIASCESLNKTSNNNLLIASLN